MADGSGIKPGLYDHLIDAEREALARSGRRVDKISLIKALRAATDLGLGDAKRAVEGYYARREDGSEPGWIDDLLDAERASASKEDRPLTKLFLIKVLREASGLRAKDARLAVEDYLKRKGGEGLPKGSIGPGGTTARIALLVLFFLAVAGFLVASR